MICEALSHTGVAAPLDVVLLVAAACVIVGAVILLLARRRGRRGGRIVALLLLAGAAVSMTAWTPTPAAASGCPPADNSLSVVQTSVMAGMAPGIAPVPIAGTVSNHGLDSTFIDVVDVEIAWVSTVAGSVVGTCDVSDYVLHDTRMPVNRTLSPGGSSPFAGASIGFNNKSGNQDTCKGATVHLRYIANPG